MQHPVIVEFYSPRVATGQQLSDALAAVGHRERRQVPARPAERGRCAGDRAGPAAAGRADRDRPDRRPAGPAVPGRAAAGPGGRRRSTRCSRPRAANGIVGRADPVGGPPPGADDEGEEAGPTRVSPPPTRPSSAATSPPPRPSSTCCCRPTPPTPRPRPARPRPACWLGRPALDPQAVLRGRRADDSVGRPAGRCRPGAGHRPGRGGLRPPDRTDQGAGGCRAGRGPGPAARAVRHRGERRPAGAQGTPCPDDRPVLIASATVGRSEQTGGPDGDNGVDRAGRLPGRHPDPRTDEYGACTPIAQPRPSSPTRPRRPATTGASKNPSKAAGSPRRMPERDLAAGPVHQPVAGDSTMVPARAGTSPSPLTRGDTPWSGTAGSRFGSSEPASRPRPAGSTERSKGTPTHRMEGRWPSPSRMPPGPSHTGVRRRNTRRYRWPRLPRLVAPSGKAALACPRERADDHPALPVRLELKRCTRAEITDCAAAVLRRSEMRRSFLGERRRRRRGRAQSARRGASQKSGPRTVLQVGHLIGAEAGRKSQPAGGPVG